jgi:hypothetical protein
VPAQFLESYKSVTLASMAATFGVSPEFLDAELVSIYLSWCGGIKVPGARRQRMCMGGSFVNCQVAALQDFSTMACAIPAVVASALQADFMVAGRLAAKIDKVAGVVETNR